MSYQPPSDSRRDLITHDRDAIHRTILANQRTFLSYLRTALTFFVTGVGFLQFFDSLVMDIIGGLFVPIGVATFVVGIVRYNKLRVRIARMTTPLHRHKNDTSEKPE